MRRVLSLLLLLPSLALGQTSVSVQTTDTIQSGCVLNAANVTCVVPLRGKTSAGFIVTAVSSPTGITLVAETSRDGTNWDGQPFFDMDTGEPFRNGIPNASLAVGFGKTIGLGGGDRFARIRVSAWTSGSATITVTATDSVPQVQGVAERSSGAVTFNAAQVAATVNLAGRRGCGFQVITISSPVGFTLVPELSWDGGTTWTATSFDSVATGLKTTSLANAAIAAGAAWTVVSAGGATHARVRASAYTSGNFVGLMVASDAIDPTLMSSTPTGATSAPPTYLGIAAQDSVTSTTMNPIRSQAHNTGAASVGLETLPAIARSAVNTTTAGRSSALSVDTTSGALNVRLTDSTTYTSPQVNAHNTAAPGAGLATMPFIARSATSGTTAGRSAAGVVDTTTGFQIASIGDSTTFTKAGVLANDTTAIANGLSVLPAVARASPTAVTAGRGEMLEMDTATGGLYVVGAATTAAVGTSTGATDVNTTTNIKASAGNVYGVSCVNNNASACFLQFYNTSGSPTCGTSVVWALALPTSGTLNIPPGAVPLANHATGIGVCMGTTRTGSTACSTANSCTVFYK